MAAMSAIDPPPPATRPFAWKHCLDVEQQASDHYEDYVLTPVFDLEAFAPKRVIELGCAGGALGAALKARHPAATVVGVDMGKRSVERAAGRVDRAIQADLDHFDFARQYRERIGQRVGLARETFEIGGAGVDRAPRLHLLQHGLLVDAFEDGGAVRIRFHS